jgi:hydroxypyruvate reductase
MTTIPRELGAVVAEALAACDPAAAVAAAWARLDAWRDGRPVIGLAIGKAAAAMARGAGPIARGVMVVPALVADGAPAGWVVHVGGHPIADARSLAAGQAVLAAVDAARPGDVVLALISGGASALAEVPAAGLELGEVSAVVAAVMAAGAPIATINRVRAALSAIKGGGLARRGRAPIVTLATSDVPGDELAVIGSGPTIAVDEPGRGAAAARALAALGIAVPRRIAAHLAALADPAPAPVVGHAEVVLPRRAVADAVGRALAARGRPARLLAAPLDDDVVAIAERIVAAVAGARGGPIVVGYGEPTVRLPAAPGAGGRAQQLALELARRWRGEDAWALVVGTDGVDGVAPPGAPAVAGAFVDGATWDAIRAAGGDPDAACRGCAAYPALALVGGHVVLGPTGVNHADLVIAGRGP